MNIYEFIGLDGNPFVAQDPEHIRGIPTKDLINPPVRSPHGKLVQLVGPFGSGKTTTLFHWATPMDKVRRVPKGLRRFLFFPFGSARILVDEGNRLPFFNWLWILLLVRLIRRNVIVASQVSRREFGILKEKQVERISINGPCVESLIRLYNERMKGNTIVENRTPALQRVMAKEIVKQSNSSWRNAETILHQWTFETANGALRRQQSQLQAPHEPDRDHW